MAAFETPWTTSMTSPSTSGNGGLHPSEQVDSNKPPTVAGFSPNSDTNTSSHRHRSTILVHQKSPLLLATPPQVTRALAYSHPFIVPLNRLAGLLSWTTGDPWESFLMVAAFWLTTLYSSYVIRFAGPVLLVTFLILGMYLRRYSPLSSTGWTGEKQKGHKRDPSDVSNSHIKHHKSLDEILATLQTFTTRCNILLDPFLRLTDFLSTQQTATSATTQPALTTLFIRIMVASPLWWALALPPPALRILTTQRITLVFGTVLLSWHSRPARISRTILWRSRTVRKTSTFLTGLEFGSPSSSAPPLPPRPGLTPSHSAIALANLRNANGGSEGIRFSFTLFENQRRWLGIGWTTSMLAYERASWTDEHLNICPSPQDFVLPEVEGGMAKWRWVGGSEWHVETGIKSKDASKNSGNNSSKGKGKDTTDKEHESEEDAWVYYDNKWRDGRRGQDGWGRYTRRRKWTRDAELVDIDPAELAKEKEDAENRTNDLEMKNTTSGRPFDTTSNADTDTDTIVAGSSSDAGTSSTTNTVVDFDTPYSSSLPADTPHKRRSWFPKPSRSRAASCVSVTGGIAIAGGVGGVVGGGAETSASGAGRGAGNSGSGGYSVSSSQHSRAAVNSGGDVLTPTIILKEREAEWGLGDDVLRDLG